MKYLDTLPLMFVALLVSVGCSDDDGDASNPYAGACVQGSYSSSLQWCYNYEDTEQRTGEEACKALSVTAWHEGETCDALGYTKQCPSGTWFRPGDDCL